MAVEGGMDLLGERAVGAPTEDVPRRADRERWFQIVMGQRFEFDDKISGTLAIVLGSGSSR